MSGYIRWDYSTRYQADGLEEIHSPWRDISPLLDANANSGPARGSTYWGESLCACYKTLKKDASVLNEGAAKTCILFCDGDNDDNEQYSSTSGI